MPHDPKLAKAYVPSFYVLIEMGRLDEAMDDLEEALRLNLESAFAIALKGRVWHYKKNYDQAIASYNQALKFNPKLVQAYQFRSDSFDAKGSKLRAKADREEAARLRGRANN